MTKVKYKLLLVPSSDDEREYENLTTFEEAFAQHLEREDSVMTYTFKSEEERNAFLEGVAAMEGYLGKGLAFTTEEETVAEKAMTLPELEKFLGQYGKNIPAKMILSDLKEFFNKA